MAKKFNTTGICIPEKHYMVNVSNKLRQIEDMIDSDEYFTINRARQYGKTTTLYLLWRDLKSKYAVINISFEGMGESAFKSEDAFVRNYSKNMQTALKREKYDNQLVEIWNLDGGLEADMSVLREKINTFCNSCDREVVLFIDEVDKSSDNQIFLSFLGLLREMYLSRPMGEMTFKSVVLTGVYDVKNLKLKLRPDEEKKYNSPWNIAVDFDVDMSFSPSEIMSILDEYESDNEIGMNKEAVADEIYKYTSGYPFLVSLVCKYLDEKMPKELERQSIWTPYGVNMAVKEILKTNNTLFDDLIKNIENNLEFKELVKDILLYGRQISFVLSNRAISLGNMFGIIDKKDGICCISNTIFETYIYNHLIIEQELNKKVFNESRNQFVTNNGELDMNLIMSKFQQLIESEYRKSDESFIEKQGRLLFLCFLKPIINGTGHYVVEPQTRDDRRMDIVVFYGSREYIIELKIWHGEKRFNDGIEQIATYMDSRLQKEGWLLTFSFNYNDEKLNSWDANYDDKLIHCTVV
jgi:hypothetical protein